MKTCEQVKAAALKFIEIIIGDGTLKSWVLLIVHFHADTSMNQLKHSWTILSNNNKKVENGSYSVDFMKK